MTNEQECQKARDVLENFNKIDENVQDKLLKGIKYIAFLYALTKREDDGGERCQNAAQV